MSLSNPMHGADLKFPEPITEPAKLRDDITRTKHTKKVKWEEMFAYRQQVLDLPLGRTIYWDLATKEDCRSFGMAICSAKNDAMKQPGREGQFRLSQKQVGTRLYLHRPVRRLTQLGTEQFVDATEAPKL